MTVSELSGAWTGTAELWVDPLGDVVQRSDCAISVGDDSLTYSWTYDGVPQHGSIRLGDASSFQDSWHQRDEAPTEAVPNPRTIATIQYTYSDEWGWRIDVSNRTPSGELVVQMTNIAPWGEEARAVRMICRRDDPSAG